MFTLVVPLLLLNLFFDFCFSKSDCFNKQIMKLCHFVTWKKATNQNTNNQTKNPSSHCLSSFTKIYQILHNPLNIPFLEYSFYKGNLLFYLHYNLLMEKHNILLNVNYHDLHMIHILLVVLLLTLSYICY